MDIVSFITPQKNDGEQVIRMSCTDANDGFSVPFLLSISLDYLRVVQKFRGIS
jgi:hypothetical protein